MMEAPKGEDKFSCKVCEKSFPSGPALGGHMRHPFSGDLKRKTKSAYGNEKTKDLIPESKLEEQVSLELIDMKKLGSGKKELLEIHIPESKSEEAARKAFYLEMRPEDRNKIQGTDSAYTKEKEKIKQAAKPLSKLEFVKKRKRTETNVSLPDLTRTVYECNTCHRTFGSQQALGGHLSGRSRGRTCLQKDIESMEVVARFNCDGYILKRDVVWAKRRRSGKVFICDLVRN